MAGLQCTLAPHLLAVYHLTSAQIGLVFVAPAAAFTLIAPLAGRLADIYPIGTLQVRGGIMNCFSMPFLNMFEIYFLLLKFIFFRAFSFVSMSIINSIFYAQYHFYYFSHYFSQTGGLFVATGYLFLLSESLFSLIRVTLNQTQSLSCLIVSFAFIDAGGALVFVTVVCVEWYMGCDHEVCFLVNFIRVSNLFD